MFPLGNACDARRLACLFRAHVFRPDRHVSAAGGGRSKVGLHVEGDGLAVFRPVKFDVENALGIGSRDVNHHGSRNLTVLDDVRRVGAHSVIQFSPVVQLEIHPDLVAVDDGFAGVVRNLDIGDGFLTGIGQEGVGFRIVVHRPSFSARSVRSAERIRALADGNQQRIAPSVSLVFRIVRRVVRQRSCQRSQG